MDRVLYRTLLLFAATLLVLWGFLLVLSPFIVAVAWALCLAALTWQPYRALAGRTGKPRLAALLMVVATALVIIVPVVAMGWLAAHEVAQLAADREGLRQGIRQIEEALPAVYRFLDDVRQTFSLGDSVEAMISQISQGVGKGLLRPVTAGAFSVLGGLFTFAIGLLVMLASLYFVYTEGAGLRAVATDLSPLPREDTERVLETLRSATVAAVLGGFVVAAVQGALGGLGFLFVGMESPVLWALVMAFCSLLPVGGAAFAWGPVVIYLFATGATGQAAFLLAWGAIVVGGIDNVMRPWLLRRVGAGGVHPMLLFFAILSGIGLFGMSGLVFGPLLIALLMAMGQIYRDHVAAYVASRPGDEPQGASS